MARKPYSLWKRPVVRPSGSKPKKQRFMYYILFWDTKKRKYGTARSAAVIAKELQLDPVEYNPSVKVGAEAIAREYVKSGKTQAPRKLLVDYCLEFWDFDNSEYVLDRKNSGLNIGRHHCNNQKRMIELHITPRAQGIFLEAIPDNWLYTLKTELIAGSGLSNKTVSAVLAAVITPIRWAKHTKVIHDDPSEGFHGVGKNAPGKGTLTAEQVAKMLALPWNDERCRVAVELAFYTGMRIGEIISLTADNLSRDETGKPVIDVSTSWSTVDGLKGTKSGKTRTAPITEEQNEALISLLENNPHNDAKTRFIFWNVDTADAPVTHKTIEGAFNRAVCAALVIDDATRVERHISVHSARHWFNSTMRGELPDEVLRKTTGHSSVEMTDHYDHTTEKDLKLIRKAQKKVLTFDHEARDKTDEKIRIRRKAKAELSAPVAVDPNA